YPFQEVATGSRPAPSAWSPPMSDPPSYSWGSWSPSLARLINAACDRFAAAWRSAVAGAGPAPRFEDFLADADGPGRAALLRELLHLEVEFRRAAGAAPRPEEYLARFPADEPLIRRALS